MDNGRRDPAIERGKLALKALVLLLVLAGLALWPFIALKRPWALRVWRRFKLVVIVYALVIFLAAMIALILRWDQIYG